ncbi:Thioredoxin-like protein [Metarhizium guizhouense ARSEF 977]|uniref:Thioredoxin-like protein n=1 Tax=Metarhizium guizhouense (strain ARSEF 977) TaxID=1276136 RepID=A0A0B4GR88_METGA|nr:Thioredoxin-like protein [Metarhizium guizhouense ARSEF 977]
METVNYVILALVIILILGPALFQDRSPIPETSGNVSKISELPELESLLSSTTYVVVDFYADWCPPCRAIAPQFSKLADEYASKGQLAFAKVNVDHCKGAAKHYNVTAMPTFLFFKNGERTSVVVQSSKQGTSTKMPKDGVVEKIQGADVKLLRSTVQALAENAQR